MLCGVAHFVELLLVVLSFNVDDVTDFAHGFHKIVGKPIGFRQAHWPIAHTEITDGNHVRLMVVLHRSWPSLKSHGWERHGLDGV